MKRTTLALLASLSLPQAFVAAADTPAAPPARPTGPVTAVKLARTKWLGPNGTAGKTDAELQKAADAGDFWAMDALGWRVKAEKGADPSKPPEERTALLTKAQIAAIQASLGGDMSARYYIALTGDAGGFQRNILAAADGGDLDAAADAGLHYLIGDLTYKMDDRWLPYDPPKGIALLDAAARAPGGGDVGAEDTLACLCWWGIGVPRDRKKAADFWNYIATHGGTGGALVVKRLATSGRPFACELDESGKDIVSADEKKADAGDWRAIQTLVGLYSDHDESLVAAYWYRRYAAALKTAAEGNDHQAYLNYMDIMLQGRIASLRQPATMVPLVKKYAATGNAEDECAYGLILYMGLYGTPVDQATGIKYLRAAAAAKNVEAQTYLDRIAKGEDPMPLAAPVTADTHPADNCFLATASARALEWPRDAAGLQILRRLRDTYMLATAARRREVATYYRIAPVIVRRINEAADAAAQWERLAKEWLLPIIERAAQPAKAARLYRKMVKELAGRWLFAAERLAAGLRR